MEQHCGRHLLRFLREHDKNHHAKDNGQNHRLQYVSLAYHHGAKIHFFFTTHKNLHFVQKPLDKNLHFVQRKRHEAG
jgi:hypothetical protein